MVYTSALCKVVMASNTEGESTQLNNNPANYDSFKEPNTGKELYVLHVNLELSSCVGNSYT